MAICSELEFRVQNFKGGLSLYSVTKRIKNNLYEKIALLERNFIGGSEATVFHLLYVGRFNNQNIRKRDIKFYLDDCIDHIETEGYIIVPDAIKEGKSMFSKEVIHENILRNDWRNIRKFLVYVLTDHKEKAPYTYSGQSYFGRAGDCLPPDIFDR